MNQALLLMNRLNQINLVDTLDSLEHDIPDVLIYIWRKRANLGMLKPHDITLLKRAIKEYQILDKENQE